MVQALRQIHAQVHAKLRTPVLRLLAQVDVEHSDALLAQCGQHAAEALHTVKLGEDVHVPRALYQPVFQRRERIHAH